MSIQPALPEHEDWSSRRTFLFATIGASIGLGNLWRFPFIAGESGGGAFVLVYIGWVLAISVPLMMAELALGRRGHQNPVNTMKMLCEEQKCHRFWHSIGWLSILAPLMAICFYSVVAGWSLAYIIKAIQGTFVGISSDQAQATFDELLASPRSLLLWYSTYLIATVFVVGQGIRRGIEWATKIMMPALFIMMVVLFVYAHIIGDTSKAYEFMFYPDFSSLEAKHVLMALGQALFSVSVATGALLTYGSYLSRDVTIPGSSWIIAITDTCAALMAGLAIFPIVFASGLDPAGGPGLMFVTLPVALGQMPGGYFFSIVFFILVFFAGFTSSVAMLEPFVSWMVENKGFKRVPATIYTGLFVWFVGLSAVLSFNLWQDIRPLFFIPLFSDRNIFSVLNFAVSDVLLPINALLIALFVGWIFRAQTLREEIGLVNETGYRVWAFFVRYIAPLGVGAIITYTIYLNVTNNVG